MGKLSVESLLTRFDSTFRNAKRALGGQADDITIKRPSILSVDQLEILYNHNALARRICDKPPEEAMRKGFELNPVGEETTDSEKVDALYRALDKYRVNQKIRWACQAGYAYGTAALWIKSSNQDTAEPLVDDLTLPDLVDLVVLDRRDLTVQSFYTAPDSPKFGMPEIYQYSAPISLGASERATAPDKKNVTTVYIHESRLVLFEPVFTSHHDRHTSGDLHGFSWSTLQHVLSVLQDSDMNWAAMGALLQTGSQPVFKIQGLIEAISAGGEAMQTRMALVDSIRSVFHSVLLDSEGEDFQYHSANLAGLGDVMDKTYLKLAAAADMPVSVLLGQAPAGLNATGESDLSLWYGRVERIQEDELRPALERVANIIANVEGIGGEWRVEFESLWSLSELEEANRRKVQADTDAVYIDRGVLLPEEVTLSRFGKGGWSDGYSEVDVDARKIALKASIEDLLNPPEPPPVAPDVAPNQESPPMAGEEDAPDDVPPNGGGDDSPEPDR